MGNIHTNIPLLKCEDGKSLIQVFGNAKINYCCMQPSVSKQLRVRSTSVNRNTFSSQAMNYLKVHVSVMTQHHLGRFRDKIQLWKSIHLLQSFIWPLLPQVSSLFSTCSLVQAASTGQGFSAITETLTWVALVLTTDASVTSVFSIARKPFMQVLPCSPAAWPSSSPTSLQQSLLLQLRSPNVLLGFVWDCNMLFNVTELVNLCSTHTHKKNPHTKKPPPKKQKKTNSEKTTTVTQTEKQRILIIWYYHHTARVHIWLRHEGGEPYVPSYLQCRPSEVF